MKTGKTMVALSGGVDSGVAAWLMREQGRECIGAYMQLFSAAPAESASASPRAWEEAQTLAQSLCLPFYIFDFEECFREKVLNRFLTAYQRGSTPNPCIDCNRHLKFKRLLREALALECDYLVTGHYARVEFAPELDRYILKKALDPMKDQSYVLYSLTQEQLKHIQLPLGKLTKSQVREIAAAQGLANARKRDSQDLCFVPDGDYGKFIQRYCQVPPGDFLDSQGRALGRHRGIIHYTIGQRRGLGLARPRPLYVKAVNAQDNTVILGENQELFSRTVWANDINLIPWPYLSEPLPVKARLRYKQAEQPAVVHQLDEDTLRVEFQEPQRAVCPGQALVLYRDDLVIGGGTIIDESQVKAA